MNTFRSLRLLLAALVLALGGVLYAPVRLSSPAALALDDGLARTPPMGWNSWNRFGCAIDEQLIRRQADALVESGMLAAGYQYVVIDDCWQVARDENGTIVADPQRFPSGIAALAAYVHSRGLKFGIYTGAGHLTCMGRPGSLGYEWQDAATYASWGVDYVKIDWCYAEVLDATAQFGLWRDAIAATGRPIVISICTWGERGPWEWGGGAGHLWRTTRDIADRWPVVLQIARENVVRAYAAGPGGWNDPDMLEVGNGRMNDTEYRTHFSLWAMMAAPLIAGNDLARMSEATRAILLNHEVIAVDQDPLGVPALIVRDDGGPQVWSRPLAGGGRAVALFNPTDWTNEVTVRWSEIGLAPGSALVRDLWDHADRGVMADAFTAAVEPHGTVMLKITSFADDGQVTSPPQGSTPERPSFSPGEEPPPDTELDPGLSPTTYPYLSDLGWSYAENAYGPAERDRSNGEDAAGDGRPITIGGVSYGKGIGVHAPSDMRFDLGGRCSAFAADIGMDDEVGEHGAVVFQVWADGRLIFDSGGVTGAMGPLPVYLEIAGASELRLVVVPMETSDYAHADWGDARVACR